MDEDATCTEVDLGLVHIVLDGDPAPPSRKGHRSPHPPLFGPCLLLPRSHISATGELLLFLLLFLNFLFLFGFREVD